MRKRSVMIVEDNAITLKVVRLTLATEGLQVLEASDGAEALRLAESTPIDLILQDLLLPDMDGFELVSRLRAEPKTRTVPIIAFSGFLSRLEHGRAAAAGFSDFLPKPVMPSRLLELVRAYLPSHPEAAALGLGRRLLVVDDDPSQLHLASVILCELGYDVTTAADGQQALELLRQRPSELVMSDVLMPRMDGFTFCAEIKADPNLAHIPVILVSSNYVEEADEQLALRMGASAFVVRSHHLGEAIQALESAIAQPDQVWIPCPIPEVNEHHQRVMLQLDRQVNRNSAIIQSSATHASMLSVLAGVSEALIKSQGVEEALPDVLSLLLEACGVSDGAIFLPHPKSRALKLVCSTGYDPGVKERLPDLLGQQALLKQTASLLTTVVLRPTDPVAESVLAGLSADYGLLIPLVADQE